MGTEASRRKAPLSARVSADALERLQRIAEEEERTVSFLVDKAIAEFVVRRRSNTKGGPDRPAGSRRRRRGGGD